MVRALSFLPVDSLAADAVAEDEGMVVDGDPERRIEDWLVCYLDERDPGANKVDWHEAIAASPLLKCGSFQAPRRAPAGEKAGEGWSKVRVSRKQGALLVRLSHSEFLRESDAEDLARELTDLVEAGHSRLVVSFGGVDRLSCLVVGVLSHLRSRCRANVGGDFRLCKVDPQFAMLCALADPGLKAAIYPDETAAFETPWPARTGPKALPVTILSALTIDGEAPIAATDDEAAFDCDEPSGEVDFSTFPSRDFSGPIAWLVAETGPKPGRAVSILGPQFTIGRDPNCDLRCPCERVSRMHARIERRGVSLLIRDLGSTNGTLLDGRPLGRDGALLAEGSRLEIGPLKFRVELRATRRDSGSIDDLVADWLRDEDSDGSIPLRDDNGTAGDEANSSLPAGSPTCRWEVIEDVLVVTPRVPDLDDEANVGPLRTVLVETLGSNLPRKVVVDLVNVSHLSSLALGVLVAHHLRLVRSGGKLRVGQAHARIVATLEQARLPMLIECFATIDEAVISSWR